MQEAGACGIAAGKKRKRNAKNSAAGEGVLITRKVMHIESVNVKMRIIRLFGKHIQSWQTKRSMSL